MRPGCNRRWEAARAVERTHRHFLSATVGSWTRVFLARFCFSYSAQHALHRVSCLSALLLLAWNWSSILGTWHSLRARLHCSRTFAGKAHSAELQKTSSS